MRRKEIRLVQTKGGKDFAHCPTMALAASAAPSTPPLPFHLPDVHLFPSSSSLPNPSLFIFPSPTRRTTTLRHSSPRPPSTTTTSPSLSDQLRPLSLTILKDGDPQNLQSLPPKPIWVNPSKPKPSVLNPHRHRRAPYSHNPDLKPITLLARNLSALPDDDPSALSAALAAALPDPPSRDTALLLLNSLRPWPKTLHFLSWLKTHNPTPSFPIDTIFYNVALKSLRFGRQYDAAERLARQMFDDGVPLDNVTYSTLITCAKRCRLFDRAIEWFEHMYKSGVVPDEVTYSAVLDVYVQMGKREEVISLYERARAVGWTPDPVAFSVLAKMFGEAGDYDGIQYVLQEMKSLSVRPNVVVYNTLLEAMGKAGKPGLARSLFEEMVAAGLSPDAKTLTALIKIYGRARWGRDALELWERMRLNRWPMDFILYNTLLSMCADLGLEAEAEKLFDDMKESSERGGSRPDSWSYTAMINIYANGGKAEKMMEVFEEMLERGVSPNVMGCTCLIQCLGKARRIKDAVNVFGISLEKGIVPDDRLCGCLLSVLALCEEGEMGMVLSCLEKANPRLVKFVQMLGKEEASFDEIKEEFRGILNETAVDARRPFCNCLIDVCRNRSFPSRRAHELFQMGILYGLYPGLHVKNSKEWSLNVRSLSIGAANTAFEEWMKSLSNTIEQEEVLPQEFSVHTGAGTHRFSQGLASAFSSHLKKMDAPFRVNEEKNGSFLASKEDLLSWLQSRVVSAAVAA